MKVYKLFFVILAATWILLVSCSGNLDPLAPLNTQDPGLRSYDAVWPQTNLWGYYDIRVDPITDTATVTPNRNGMFTANIVSFLNQKPASLGVVLNGKTQTTGYIDIDLDISITHPFADSPQFNGYDVRGIFIGNGSGTFQLSGTDYHHSIKGSDQMMLFDPLSLPETSSGGAPDGYTRWYNPTEFTTPGLFGYQPGSLASKNYTGTATLNPYRYFGDGLGADGKLLPYIESPLTTGVFSSGATNTRRYYIRFPSQGPGLKFNYAIIANWKGVLPADHPANAPEAVAASINITEDIFFNSPTDFGGNLKFDIGVYDWYSALDVGVMHDYTVVVMSTVLKAPHVATPAEMTPLDAGPHLFTYRFDLPADQVDSLDNNEMWAAVKYDTADYKNPPGVPNLAGDDPLIAFFRKDVPVHPGTPSYDVSMTSSFDFDPVNIDAPAGVTVTWTNDSAFPHTSTSDPLNPVAGGPNSDSQFPNGLTTGQQYSWVVPDVPPGTIFYYHCRFHGFPGDGSSYGSGMVGSVTVL